MNVLTVTSPAYADFPRVIPDGATVVEIPQHGDAAFSSPTFWMQCRDKIRAVTSALERLPSGDLLLYLDADVSVFKPWGYFERRFVDTGADVVFQFEKMHGLCTGFFVVRRTERILSAFLRAVNMTSNLANDEIAMAGVMRNVPYAVFSPADVFGYGMISPQVWDGVSPLDFEIPPGIGAFHANWCVGIERKAALMRHVISLALRR